MPENNNMNMQSTPQVPEMPTNNPMAAPVPDMSGMPQVPQMEMMPPVQPMPQEMPVQGVPEMPQAPQMDTVPEMMPAAPVPEATSVPEEVPQGMPTAIPNDMDNSTFDYNQLYGNVETTQEVAPQAEETVINPAMNQTPIVLGKDVTASAPTVTDITPTFDTSVLEDDLPDDLRIKKEEKLINTIATESQQEKAEGRRNLLFLVILFGVLIVAVLVIFPLMTKM